MAGKMPWFKDGLRFTCTGCGDCCSGAPGFVWVVDQEVSDLAQLLGISKEEFCARYTRKVGRRRSLVEFANGDCVFLDPQTRKCKVYAARPRQCRTWPFWESNLESAETWAHTCEVCPGSGKGQLYTVDEVLRQSKVVRV